jgi:hypothetical protein
MRDAAGHSIAIAASSGLHHARAVRRFRHEIACYLHKPLYVNALADKVEAGSRNQHRMSFA